VEWFKTRNAEIHATLVASINITVLADIVIFFY